MFLMHGMSVWLVEETPPYEPVYAVDSRARKGLRSTHASAYVLLSSVTPMYSFGWRTRSAMKEPGPKSARAVVSSGPLS